VLRTWFPIETERLRLRLLEHDDLDGFAALFGDPEIVRYLYWPVRQRAELEAVLASKIERAALERPGDAADFAITLRSGGPLLGTVSFSWADNEHRQGEIGYILDPAHAGSGYATEASRELLRLGFEQLGLHRIHGRMDARNTASARVLERLGMRREALLVENEYVKGEWTDELVYAMVDREWYDLTRAADA
jgi:RimJ/RimL family protein N-acetyltransferase